MQTSAPCACPPACIPGPQHLTTFDQRPPLTSVAARTPISQACQPLCSVFVCVLHICTHGAAVALLEWVQHVAPPSSQLCSRPVRKARDRVGWPQGFAFQRLLGLRATLGSAACLSEGPIGRASGSVGPPSNCSAVSTLRHTNQAPCTSQAQQLLPQQRNADLAAASIELPGLHISGAAVSAVMETLGVEEGGALMTGRTNNHRALVLDAAYRPINVINWAKAIKMDMAGRVRGCCLLLCAVCEDAVAAAVLPAWVQQASTHDDGQCGARAWLHATLEPPRASVQSVTH
jgi:hypothetical protein